MNHLDKEKKMEICKLSIFNYFSKHSYDGIMEKLVLELCHQTVGPITKTKNHFSFKVC